MLSKGISWQTTSLAGWLRCQQTQAEPSWASSGLRLTLCPHISGVSRNLTAQKSCALLLLCRREGHSLLLKFWPLFLASLGAKTAASVERHIQPSSSWISEGNAKPWWCEGEAGVKEFSRRGKQGYLSMPPLQFDLLIYMKKNLTEIAPYLLKCNSTETATNVTFLLS